MKTQTPLFCDLRDVQVIRDCGNFVVVRYPNSEIEAMTHVELERDYVYDSRKNAYVGRQSHYFIEWKGPTFAYADGIYDSGAMICVDNLKDIVIYTSSQFSRRFVVY
ncbi:MAG: hypothetical protein IJ689_04700 [Alphaproteobacteria bacterium]|nr:hypothetical protein [Alphaproteobacteria bacterium]